MKNGSAKDKKDRISIRINHQRHLAAQAVAEDLAEIAQPNSLKQ
ncbi:hypothetical protein [Lactiplantibacillus daowaiensis]|uniref:Uncharacterized protein n=1 Tax=Lactiplantibacillus daowaiensis TaxID=2559918 RepID=A0ABW1S4A1_9LACO|nr:hypothetical protein [Lactiplantibacillus daowaiensis]